ncbi:hypothetical protein K449DRAFT_431577, partial [Hypoxylon sp. EC38]
MAPQKRKRLHDEPPQPPRRATRSHPDEPERQLRSGRVRASVPDKASSPSVEALVVKSTKGDAPKPIARKAGRPPSKQQTKRRVLKQDIQPDVKDSEDELDAQEKDEEEEHDTS